MGEHNTSGDRKAPKLARLSAAVVPAAGLVAVLVGCFVAWSNASAGIGWFAYAPLSNQLFLGSGMAFVSQGMQIGLAVAVVGLLVLAFWAGYRIGRRASPTDQVAGPRIE
jgi:heme/copper-type cytochrome/quinol oxidase subunit 1